MATLKSLNNDLLPILEDARLAPSVHNAQPWKVKLLDDNSVIIGTDPTHGLKQSDPVGRQTIISLGIFYEAFILAARSKGWELKDSQMQNKQISLEFVPVKSPVPKSVADDIKNLKSRCSDRSTYRPVMVPQATIRRLKNVSDLPGTTLWVNTEPDFIRKTAELTAKGIGLALTSPDFRKELSEYLTLPWFNQRGISVLTLNLPLPLAIMEPWLIRWGLGIKQEVETERRRWLSASGIILITTKGDIDKDWFSAGRSYLRASLAAEQLGFAQATSAATVEASTFHEDIEEMLGTNERLQAVIRIGKTGAKKVYSQRVSATDLMTT